ncbi:MAG: hypothetical protein SWX82_29770 [Cyanobacteriota bacterium]|nr:hypothetical protein [Cyanobacteriota bacterium]
MAKKKKYPTPGNPEIEKYRIQAKVPGRPNDGHLTLRMPSDTLSRIKTLPNWQDKVRAKLEELLQEEGRVITASK